MARIIHVNYSVTGREIDVGAGVGVTGETGIGPATALHDQGDTYWSTSGAGVLCMVVGTNSAGAFNARILMLPVSTTAAWISA